MSYTESLDHPWHTPYLYSCPSHDCIISNFTSHWFHLTQTLSPDPLDWCHPPLNYPHSRLGDSPYKFRHNKTMFFGPYHHEHFKLLAFRTHLLWSCPDRISSAQYQTSNKRGFSKNPLWNQALMQGSLMACKQSNAKKHFSLFIKLVCMYLCLQRFRQWLGQGVFKWSTILSHWYLT